MISTTQQMILIAAREVLSNADPCVVFEFCDFANDIAMRLCDEIEDAEDIDEDEGKDE